MNRKREIFLAAISAVTWLSVGAIAGEHVRTTYHQLDLGQPAGVRLPIGFQDHTGQVVNDALTLIERNQSEGAPLDQHWYAFRRFGESLEEIVSATEVLFYGGREADILRALSDQYTSMSPIEPNQDRGEIRLFKARRHSGSLDLIIMGQNGREVALKTAIRLIYLFKFMDSKLKHLRGENLDLFLRKIRIYLSSTPPRQEFISFFQRYRINDPEAVVIGFQRDARAVLQEAGMDQPRRHSSDSLRVNWYPDVNGKKVLLVSINGNRIFASRVGELVKAMLATFRAPPRVVVFFGSAGAIDSAELVGHVVAPTVVVSDDYFNPHRSTGKVAHIVRNRAATIVSVKTAHVSVESMVVETVNWAARKRQRRIMTVDKELYHVINAINTSPYAGEIQVFAGMFVTDNVSATLGRGTATLEHAEDKIARTAAIRREFCKKVFAEAGIISGWSTTTRQRIQVGP